MKKIIYSMAVLMMGLAFTACSSDDDNNSDNNLAEKDQAMEAITSQYVNNVVFPTVSAALSSEHVQPGRAVSRSSMVPPPTSASTPTSTLGPSTERHWQRP